VSGRHPFTLLALAAALPALAWTLPAPWGPAATLIVALTLCLPAPRVARTAFFTAAPFWLFLFLLHDRATALAIALRLSTMIASFVWLVAILPPARLVEALVSAGYSVHVAFLFAATLSAVPALRARAQRIVDAQRCRGLATRGGPLTRLRALRALALPLVLSALHEVDERALALETRGLSAGTRRTPLAPPPDSWVERVTRWALVTGCVGAIVGRVLWRV
jgi:energy-coupling factor transport system permease protein